MWLKIRDIAKHISEEMESQIQVHGRLCEGRVYFHPTAGIRGLQCTNQHKLLVTEDDLKFLASYGELVAFARESE